MARDKPICAAVSTIQLLVTFSNEQHQQYRRFESDALNALFLQTIYRFYGFSCHQAMRRGTFRLPVPALRVKSSLMSASTAKRLINYMPFCAWCVGVAFLRGRADRAVRDRKF
jgi:hypothetical protein